jgi:hypothetical protein
MTQFDALSVLQNAGVPLTDITEEQRAVFAGLTSDEVSVLTSVKGRLDAVTPDVAAHSNDFGVINH